MEFQLLSIVCFMAFYGCYFIKMLCQKRQGIQTDQMGKGKTGPAKYVEITLKMTAVLVLIAGLVSIFLDTGQSSPPAVRVIGAIMSIAGTVVFIAAVWIMKDSWRAGVSTTDQTELVTGGIYQISRNPAFLGFDLLYLGTLLMFFNWVLCFLTVFALIIYHLQIVAVEEKFLTFEFGNQYLQYRKKVCRYIGRKY